MNYLIIEPHADDAFLSTFYESNNIIKQNSNVFLLTISNSTVTGEFRDSSKYCDYKHYTYIDDNNFVQQIFFNETKPLWYNKTISNIELSNTYFKKYNYIYKGIESRIRKYVEIIKPSVIITCYGLLHVQHVLTRKAVDAIFKGEKYYFLDNPYFSLKEANMVNVNFTKKLSVEQALKKKNLFKKLYPSEVYMENIYPDIFFLYEIVYGKNFS